jgi:hypothetical protein
MCIAYCIKPDLRMKVLVGKYNVIFCSSVQSTEPAMRIRSAMAPPLQRCDCQHVFSTVLSKIPESVPRSLFLPSDVPTRNNGQPRKRRAKV